MDVSRARILPALVRASNSLPLLQVKWDDSQFSGDREGARSQIEEVPRM